MNSLSRRYSMVSWPVLHWRCSEDDQKEVWGRKVWGIGLEEPRNPFNSKILWSQEVRKALFLWKVFTIVLLSLSGEGMTVLHNCRRMDALLAHSSFAASRIRVSACIPLWNRNWASHLHLLPNCCHSFLTDPSVFIFTLLYFVLYPAKRSFTWQTRPNFPLQL